MEATLLEFAKQFGLSATLVAVLLWFILKYVKDALDKIVAFEGEQAITMALMCDRLGVDYQERKFGGRQ